MCTENTTEAFSLPDRQIRLELAKAALAGGQGVKRAADFYRWVTGEEPAEENLADIPVATIIPDLDKVGISFMTKCKANGIETIADLVALGSKGFHEMGGVGPTTHKHVAKALEQRYGITDW